MKHTLYTVMAAAALLGMVSCLPEGNETIIISPAEPGSEIPGVPGDSEATPTPDIASANITLPGHTTTLLCYGTVPYLTMVGNGICDSAGNPLTLCGTGEPNQNMWLEIDGRPKAINVQPASAASPVPCDVVLLIDNSRSMADEVDAIINGIDEWCSRLEASGLQLRLGMVGYGEGRTSINGAFDLAEPSELISFLKRDAQGVERARGFGGPRASELAEVAHRLYYNSSPVNECGMPALYFATDLFSFDNNANRVYINFTDEYNQPGDNKLFSVENLNPERGYWTPALGTIHTVFSGPDNFFTSEDPALMSIYTGGTVTTCRPDFTSATGARLTLCDIKATDVLCHSWRVRCTNVIGVADGGAHTYTLTVYDRATDTRGQQTYTTILR